MLNSEANAIELVASVHTYLRCLNDAHLEPFLLIGQRGPIASDHIAFGFLLLAPGTEYPPHRHAAEEVYLPLTGPSFWKMGDDEWKNRPIGVPLYHRSWLTHTMRSESVPLLALYLWRGGNLVQKSRID